jgi:hypothetical protein
MSRASNTKPPTSVGSVITSEFASEYAGCERTISVLYSPHGVPFEVIEPWVSSHLAPESALPPLAMIHSTTVVDVPWYLGGNMATGCPGGLEIARQLLPTVWIAAHDEGKEFSGTASKNVWKTEYDIMDAQTKLWEELLEQGQRRKPQILRLDAGETLRIDHLCANKLAEETTQTVKKEEEITGKEDAEDLADASCSPVGKDHEPA